MRIPEGISAGRVKGFTSENVERFFNVYEYELREVNNLVHRIFSVDEAGIISVEHRQ